MAGPANGLDTQPGDVEAASNGDPAELTRKGGDQRPQPQGGRTEPDQGGGIHADRAQQGRRLAVAHPGGDREIFSLDDLIASFSIEHISKGGARFDYEKAKWFNQKYIQAADNAVLTTYVRPLAEAKGYHPTDEYLTQAIGLMKERVTFLPDFVETGDFLFEPVRSYDTEALGKKWIGDIPAVFAVLTEKVATFEPFNGPDLEEMVKQFATERSLKAGDLMPLLRIALAGTTKGPGVFDTMLTLGREETVRRMERLLNLES